ncbi:hypothetical protein [Nocardia cyriacigeorgica]|uniref:hypothetical protein n=1 Tax=Nocardia cyriacigeorgica TaxID=135487 RepID=UPI002457A6E2|nr:hypothetical protein [Nocardia cyriacigeorgica]
MQQASAPTGSGVTPAANTTPPPGRIPGPDGGIVYTFPDGRTQKVSENVAKALDAAFADKSGTSAKEAYKNTAAKWEEDKRAGDSVDPSQLMTGDIATWTADTVAGEPRSTLVPDDKGGEARTALLVVFGPAESGTLEAICGGELQQFTPELSDAQGAFGEFSGFRRPRNIELAAPKGDTDTGVPTGDPAATQAGAVPVVAPV